jgi:alkylhydroperoxidase family enzyme
VAGEPAPTPPASTRVEMKRRIEALKGRTARLPLPVPTAEEAASGRSLVNNGRLRRTYLPASWTGFVIPGWGGGSSRSRPASTAAVLKTLQASPDYAFKTRLFWVVSRGNDCQYCLGHQELKLRRAGMQDDQIAALDCRWELFPQNEQAALAFTHKLTRSPHKLSEADITRLKAHFNDKQIIDIAYTVARYNAVNRWTASTGIPQDQSFGGEEQTELETPTSPEFANVPSLVAPLDVPARPDWESPQDLQAALADTRTRTPLVELPAVDASKAVIAADTPGATPPVWLRAMSELPIALEAWRQRQGLVRDGQTDAKLRAQIAYVSARENRAWYAAGHARTRYLALGGDEQALASFAALEQAATTPGHAEALRFARKLTSAPHTIVDDDVERLKAHFSNHEIAEIIDVTCDANGFDRFTEVLRLPLES